MSAFLEHFYVTLISARGDLMIQFLRDAEDVSREYATIGMRGGRRIRMRARERERGEDEFILPG